MEIAIIKEKKNIMFDDVTILSINEYSDYKNDIPVCNDSWWLRGPAEICGKVSYVNGKSVDWGLEKLRKEGQSKRGIRPALKIAEHERSGLSIGDRFVLDNRLWTVISPEYALCDVIIGKCVFPNIQKILGKWFDGLKETDNAKEENVRRLNALCDVLIEKPGEHLNPLYIYGSSFDRKAEILTMINNRFSPQNTVLRVNGNEQSSSSTITDVDVFLIDEIQMLSGDDEDTQKEIADYIRGMIHSNIQIICTGDKPANMLPIIDSLKAILLSGVCWELK